MRIKSILSKVVRRIGIFFFLSTVLYAFWLRFFPPIATPLMIQRAFAEQPAPNGAPFSFNARWKSLDNINPKMQFAVVAAEDANFYHHFGLDWEAMYNAFKHNMNSKQKIGGSTISQQVAKNVFLWNGRSYLRKVLEIYFTILIEIVWGKDRIMEMYLNIAETGNGLFGVEAASQFYFHHSAQYLTQKECALLAATLPNPIKYTPFSSYAKQKSKRIVRYMRYVEKMRQEAN